MLHISQAQGVHLESACRDVFDVGFVDIVEFNNIISKVQQNRKQRTVGTDIT